MALRAAISSSMSHLPAAAFKGELSNPQNEVGRVPALKGGLHGLIGGSHQFRQFAFLAVLYQYLRQFIVVFTHNQGTFSIFDSALRFQRQCKDMSMFHIMQLFLSNIEIIFQKSI